MAVESADAQDDWDSLSALTPLEESSCRACACDEILCGCRPCGERELEAVLEQKCGDDAAALEDEFALGVHEEGADLDHPLRGRKANGDVPRFAECAHEVAIRERFRCGHIHNAVSLFGDLRLGEKQISGAAVVEVVNPGDELVAGADRSAEAFANETARAPRRRRPGRGS